MLKRILSAVLLLAMLLSLAACGGGTTDKGEVNTSPGTTVQPTQGTGGETAQPTQKAGTPQPTQGAGAETSQPTQEVETPQPTEEPAAISYIFSARPVAAFEVTGFDLHSTYDGPYTDVEGYSYELPVVKLTPGENSFIIFCMQADFDIAGSVSVAAIRSPAGSGPWEGNTYSCFDAIPDPLPEGYALFYKQDYSYQEEEYDGGYLSTMDAVLHWIYFSELHHPGAAQDDSICVVDVAPFPGLPGIDTVEGVVAAMADTFQELGGIVTQIDVDEALARCHVEVG